MMREGKGQYNLLIQCICLQWIYCSDGRLPKALKNIHIHTKALLQGELSISLQILEVIMMPVFLSSLISWWSRLGVSLGRKALLPPRNIPGFPLVFLSHSSPFIEWATATDNIFYFSFFLPTALCCYTWAFRDVKGMLCPCSHESYQHVTLIMKTIKHVQVGVLIFFKAKALCTYRAGLYLCRTKLCLQQHQHQQHAGGINPASLTSVSKGPETRKRCLWGAG